MRGENWCMANSDPNLRRRHHTVPKFYLRGFALDEQIATVRLPGDHRFVQSIGDATVGKDFYSVEGHEDGDDVIEKALSEIEGAAATVFRKIDEGTWPLPIEDRMTMGIFIALQAARVPVHRRTVDHMATEMLRIQIGAGGKSGLRKRMEDDGSKVTEAELEAMWAMATQPGGPPIRGNNALHIEIMAKTSDEILKYVVGRPWSLVRFDRRSLITSDAPVSLVPDPAEDPSHGVGYMTAWGITFPLSRRTGLLISSPKVLMEAGIPVERVHRGEFDRTQDPTTVLERFFNLHTVSGASEWIFHHPNDDNFVPSPLPSPNLVTVRMEGEPFEFTGEPWFGQSGQPGP